MYLCPVNNTVEEIFMYLYAPLTYYKERNRVKNKTRNK